MFSTCFQKASGQHLFMTLESFSDPFWSNFDPDPGGTLGGSLGPPWDTFGPRPQKSANKHQQHNFLDLILEALFHQVFCIFHCSFKLLLGEPSEPLFKWFWGYFESISGIVFPTFWRNWKPWKMSPLQCETTVFEYPAARFFIIFPSIFQDKF